MTTAPMYAPFQYMQHGQPPHEPPQRFIQPGMGGGEIAPPDHVPGVQVTGATPKLRSQHPSSDIPNSSPLQVSIDHPYPNVMAIAPKLPSASSSIPSAAPPKSTMGPRQRTAEDEEARKARKREMGRERQRRKRLRDKEKREAARANHALSGDIYQQFAGRPAGDRSSFTSTSSFEGISSSASFSNIPPLSMGFSPSQSFVSSASTASLSDVSSPGASLSPTMAGFASDSSWNEHTAVFSNLSLSGDGTVRASKHRPVHAFNHGHPMSRHASDNDDYEYGLQRSGSKRRKSDAGEVAVGLGVTVDYEDWSNTARRPRQSRRTASVPDGAIFDVHNSDPPTLPSNFHQNVVRVPPSSTATPEGIFFATSVVAAVSASEWSAILQSRLGLTGELLERMGNDLAITYDRWRVEQGLNPVTLDQETRMSIQTSSPPVPTSPSSASFATPSQRNPDVMQQQPSPSTSARGGAPAAPGTPQSQTKAGHLSSNASPTNPNPQTPAQHQSVFPPQPFTGDPSWQSAAPMYDSDWRNQFAQQGKEQYGNPNVVIPSPGMSGQDFNGPRGAFNQNARGVPANTPLYYNPQIPQQPGMRPDGQVFQGFSQ